MSLDRVESSPFKRGLKFASYILTYKIILGAAELSNGERNEYAADHHYDKYFD